MRADRYQVNQVRISFGLVDKNKRTAWKGGYNTVMMMARCDQRKRQLESDWQLLKRL